MIPIKLKNGYTFLQIADEFYYKLINGRQKKKLTIIENWCNKNLIINKKVYSFKDVVTADLENLIIIKKHIVNNSLSFNELREGKNCYIADTLYESINRESFTEKLDLSVCPYCNRNYINSTHEKTTYELDHFFSKALYPILAVSFVNLIPVCSYCNREKRTNEFDYSPHDVTFTANDLSCFNYQLLGADFLQNNKSIKIYIEARDVLKKNVELLGLEGLYQYHTDSVLELIKRSMLYNKTYIQNLYADHQDLFSSENEVYRVVFGNYIDEKDYSKRPLSKLTHDILKQLNIL